MQKISQSFSVFTISSQPENIVIFVIVVYVIHGLGKIHTTSNIYTSTGMSQILSILLLGMCLEEKNVSSLFCITWFKGIHLYQCLESYWGDPRNLSKIIHAINDHFYNLFYNQISGTSLDQWVPSQVDLCRHLIHDLLSDETIEKLGFDNGEVVDWSWILHHFEFESFHLFGFLDDFVIQTVCPGNSSSQGQHFAPDIQRAFYSGYLQKHSLKAQIA